MCGIGVTSRISVISSPIACNERMAVSLPFPVPLTLIITDFNPNAIASLPAASAANPAAYGVDFFEPLYPTVPEEAHLITLPCKSVIVTMVLLMVE